MAAGTLYIVATPIGNLEDITLRALRVLKEADRIAAEDTRHTRKLLTHYGISTPLISYHAHNQASRGPELIRRLTEGENIALVTDAGTPGFSDPGADLVARAWEAGVRVEAAPGRLFVPPGQSETHSAIDNIHLRTGVEPGGGGGGGQYFPFMPNPYGLFKSQLNLRGMYGLAKIGV